MCLVLVSCSDAVRKPADIISNSVSSVVVTLDAPSILHCYAYGYPRPAVLWWKEDTMLPRNSVQYEQRRDNSLVIRHVTLTALGPYTCQAYNGLGRAASWTTTLHAVGSFTPLDPQDFKFLVYLVPPPNVPIQPDPSNRLPSQSEITSITPLHPTPHVVFSGTFMLRLRTSTYSIPNYLYFTSVASKSGKVDVRTTCS